MRMLTVLCCLVAGTLASIPRISHEDKVPSHTERDTNAIDPDWQDLVPNSIWSQLWAHTSFSDKATSTGIGLPNQLSLPYPESKILAPDNNEWPETYPLHQTYATDKHLDSTPFPENVKYSPLSFHLHPTANSDLTPTYSNPTWIEGPSQRNVFPKSDYDPLWTEPPIPSLDSPTLDIIPSYEGLTHPFPMPLTVPGPKEPPVPQSIHESIQKNVALMVQLIKNSPYYLPPPQALLKPSHQATSNHVLTHHLELHAFKKHDPSPPSSNLLLEQKFPTLSQHRHPYLQAPTVSYIRPITTLQRDGGTTYSVSIPGAHQSITIGKSDLFKINGQGMYA